MGASYDELEWAMEAVEKNLDLDDLTDKQKEIVKIYQKFNSQNKHKMEPIPVCEIPYPLLK